MLPWCITPPHTVCAVHLKLLICHVVCMVTCVSLQVIDDVSGRTLAAASTLTAEVKSSVEGNGGNVVSSDRDCVLQQQIYREPADNGAACLMVQVVSRLI